MSKNLSRLAILFSFLLNIAFLGTYLYREVPRWAGKAQPQGVPLPYQAVQFTEAQQKKFDPIREKFHARVKEIGSEIKREQLQLVEQVAQPEPDMGAIRATQERIRGLQRTMQDVVIGHLVESSSIFTAEQRAQYFGVLRERIEKAEPMSPPWMRPEGTARGAR